MIDTICFDLFFTLVKPKYNEIRNEYDVFNISRDAWERVTENEELYGRRARGLVIEPRSIIELIVRELNIVYDNEMIDEALELREKRFKEALINVEPTIVDVLIDLKDKGIKLCIISNADSIDVLHWNESPISNIFDEVLFSFEVGCLKPEKEIYELALARMDVKADQCIFVGDGGSDELKGAKEFGMNTVQCTHLVNSSNKIAEADYVIDEFSKLISLIET